MVHVVKIIESVSFKLHTKLYEADKFLSYPISVPSESVQLHEDDPSILILLQFFQQTIGFCVTYFINHDGASRGAVKP